MAVVAREYLDQMGCSECAKKAGSNGHVHTEDDRLFFHSRCHPNAPTWTSYLDGKLRVECVECQKTIVEVVVADETD